MVEKWASHLQHKIVCLLFWVWILHEFCVIASNPFWIVAYGSLWICSGWLWRKNWWIKCSSTFYGLIETICMQSNNRIQYLLGYSSLCPSANHYVLFVHNFTRNSDRPLHDQFFIHECDVNAQCWFVLISLIFASDNLSINTLYLLDLLHEWQYQKAHNICNRMSRLCWIYRLSSLSICSPTGWVPTQGESQWGFEL